MLAAVPELSMKDHACTRRTFLRWGATAALGAPFAFTTTNSILAAEIGSDTQSPLAPGRSTAKVSHVACRSYGPEVRIAMQKCFDLLGGIGSLVNHKTVTVKVNLTGT